MLTKSVFEKLRLLEALKCLSKICGEFLAIISYTVQAIVD